MTDKQSSRRSDEDLDNLKRDWKRDPCWDIEETAGFEAHRDELKAWRNEFVAECERRDREELEDEAKQLGVTVAEASLLRSCDSTKRHAIYDAVITLRHLFKLAGVDHSDVESDIGSFVEQVVAAADASAQQQSILARANPPNGR